MVAVTSTAPGETIAKTDRVPVFAVGVNRWLLYVLRASALGLAALHTVVAISRQSMNEDGINYLDMGTAIVQGDWRAALNATWSPLYSIIVGLVVHLGHPSVWWEFPAVQLANFVILAATMVCFEFFWRELTRSVSQDQVANGFSRFPGAAWLTLGYSLWIWSSLSLIGIWSVNPDMLVAAFVYLASGLLLRVGLRRPPRLLLATLGAVLGTAYLAKAAMFPLGLACLLLATGILHARWRLATRAVWILLGFALVAGPIVLALSISAGHFTFGDVGPFTYMKHVNRLHYPHWEETVRRVNGVPKHPPRRILDDPPVYEFAIPVNGTYPMSFNPAYWTEGLSPRLDPRQQFNAFASNVMFYFDLFARRQGGFIAIAVLLLVLTTRPRFRRAPAETALIVWGGSAFALYSLVYVSPRYVAPFVVIFWSGLLACVRLPDNPAYRRVGTASVWVLVLAVCVNLVAANTEGLAKVMRFSPGLPSDPGPARAALESTETPSAMHPAIAEGLLGLGITKGDRVGFIGYSYSAFWARLARVRIIAELAPQHAPAFWTASGDRQHSVLRAFAAAGATAVVAEPVRGVPIPDGWIRVGDTGYLVRFVR